MNNKLYKKIIIILYTISILILLFCLKVRITPNIYIKTDVRLLLLLLVCINIYIIGYIQVKVLKWNKKVLKVNLITYFLIYNIIIFTLTLFDEIYGRKGMVHINWSIDLFNTYINNSFNIIPFKTIKLYIKGYQNGLINYHYFFMNIIGNICAFMPYAIFIPLIFKKINSFNKYISTMIIIIVCIELLQFTTMSGSCDIDDLILNLLGTSIMYFICNIKLIKKYIRKFFLYE